ncbi:MAG: protein translocase subunit SecDF, partial [Bacteroidaceae bacterium]|nr:protein translocase subunit SecDF [Bacteroidaceae bacterium]
MQNKGFVKIFAVLLTLICIFYLSFSFVTRHYESKAAAMGKEEGAAFLDSVMKEKVYLNIYTLKECREMEIGLGLDLKGGMNVILEVSVPDVVKTLADHKTDKAFNDAVANAAAQAEQSQKDFITLFVSEYHKLAPNSRLAEIFATQQLKGKVSTSSSDSEVESVLREEVKAAVDNSYNVLRTRIDRFGVAQPNIQTLEGQTGRIMVEMPGIKEPERVRKLLQGSANLEFWETYDANEVYPFLVSADEHVRDIIAGTDTTAKAATADTAAVAQSSAKSVTETLSALTNKSDVAKKSSAIVDKEHPLLSKLNPANYGCVVGYAVARDTADINKYLAMAKNTLPSDLSLKWGVKGVTFGEKNKTEYFELYAIKVTQRDGRAPLEGDVVTDAKDEFDHTTGRPCVSMQMNSDGARRWAALTKANVGRAIAIVLDGLVYSAPNVNNEINGGNSQITGNFTPEDTKDLANVLKSGKMPAPTHIV